MLHLSKIFSVCFIAAVFVSLNGVTASNSLHASAEDVEVGKLTPGGIYRYKELGSLTKKILLPNGEDINTWKAPKNISSSFVLYYAGQDFEGRPVGIVEAGKWPVKQTVQAGYVKELQYHSLQLLRRIVQVVHERHEEDDSVSTGIMIWDFKDFQLEQMFYFPGRFPGILFFVETTRFILTFAQEYGYLLDKYLDELIFINVNRAAEVFLDFLRPIIGGFASRILTFGNQETKWKPELLRRFPKETLPEWYGGSPDFKPLRVFG